MEAGKLTASDGNRVNVGNGSNGDLNVNNWPDNKPNSNIGVSVSRNFPLYRKYPR